MLFSFLFLICISPVLLFVCGIERNFSFYTCIYIHPTYILLFGTFKILGTKDTYQLLESFCAHNREKEEERNIKLFSPTAFGRRKKKRFSSSEKFFPLSVKIQFLFNSRLVQNGNAVVWKVLLINMKENL